MSALLADTTLIVQNPSTIISGTASQNCFVNANANTVSAAYSAQRPMLRSIAAASGREARKKRADARADAR